MGMRGREPRGAVVGGAGEVREQRAKITGEPRETILLLMMSNLRRRRRDQKNGESRVKEKEMDARRGGDREVRKEGGERVRRREGREAKR